MSNQNEIDCNPPGAEEQTLRQIEQAKTNADHARTVADERQRVVTRQAQGVSEATRALEQGLADVRRREAEREALLKGPLGK